MKDFDDAAGARMQRARVAREGLVGRTVAGRYVLRGLLGHGGMGAVYEAEHLGFGKRVAIKFVDSEFATDPMVVARFAREARAMSAIESAHIVAIFDAGTDDGRPYLVMELLRGEDLGQHLRRTTRVPLGEAMHVVAQVLKGLARAHAAGIVHRDLKPDNVFLVKHDADPTFAKIVDFGISKIERPRASTHSLALTGRGTVLGTPFYMSPEQARSSPDVDGRTDLYSVGAILFECLTGRPPHIGESNEQVLLSICMSEAPEVSAIESSILPDVSAFVARALGRDRSVRFASAEHMLAALHEIAPEERTRVPLDAPSAALLSSGTTPLGATVIGGGAPRSSRPPASISGASSTRTQLGRTMFGTPPVPVTRADVPPDRRNKRCPKSRRPTAVALAIAVAATLTGVGVTFGAITLLGDHREATMRAAVSEPSAQEEAAVGRLEAATLASGAASSLGDGGAITYPQASASSRASHGASPVSRPAPRTPDDVPR